MASGMFSFSSPRVSHKHVLVFMPFIYLFVCAPFYTYLGCTHAHSTTPIAVIYVHIFSDDDISLLVIVVDVNPIWWGQQAQRQTEVELSTLIILNIECFSPKNVSNLTFCIH